MSAMPPKRKGAPKHRPNAKRTVANTARALEEREEQEEEQEQVFSDNLKTLFHRKFFLEKPTECVRAKVKASRCSSRGGQLIFTPCGSETLASLFRLGARMTAHAY